MADENVNGCVPAVGFAENFEDWRTIAKVCLGCGEKYLPKRRLIQLYCSNRCGSRLRMRKWRNGGVNDAGGDAGSSVGVGGQEGVQAGLGTGGSVDNGPTQKTGQD